MFYLLIGLVLVVLGFNFYARKKFLTYLRQLQAANIPLSFKQIFNHNLRKQQLHSQYPEHIELIESFSHFTRKSIRSVILVFGGFILIAIFIQLFT